MGMAAKVEGEIKAALENADPSTLRSEVAVLGIVQRFAMQGFDGGNKADWPIISPMQATLNYKDNASVPDDTHDTVIRVEVQPMDAVMRIADTELLLEFTTNLMSVLDKHRPKPGKEAPQLPAVPEQPGEPVSLSKAVEESEKKAAEKLPGSQTLTENSSLKISAAMERLSFTAVNDKASRSYPLMIMKLEGIKADIFQSNKKGDLGPSKDVDALIKSLSCELGLEQKIEESEADYNMVFLYRVWMMNECVGNLG